MPARTVAGRPQDSVRAGQSKRLGRQTLLDGLRPKFLALRDTTQDCSERLRRIETAPDKRFPITSLPWFQNVVQGCTICANLPVRRAAWIVFHEDRPYSGTLTDLYERRLLGSLATSTGHPHISRC